MYKFNQDPMSERSTDASESFRYLLKDFELKHFAFADFPSADRSGLVENLIDTNWPPHRLLQLDQSEAFYRNKLIKELRKSVLPVVAEIFTRTGSKNARGLTDCVMPVLDQELAGTVGVALHDADHRHYLVLLSGWDQGADETKLARLFLRVTKIIDEYRPRKVPANAPLSGRELDCLRWSAAGKSSEEIALILSLSSHTVNEYLKQAMRKLDAVTRVQAVAAACRLRLI